MTRHIIDLISSSPRPFHGASSDSPPSPQKQNAASFVPNGASSHHATANQPPITQGVIHTAIHKWSSTSTRMKTKSGVFDEIDDSLFDLLDEPQPKRRKVLEPDARHKEPFDSPASTKSASNPDSKHPPLMSHDRPLSKRPALEPIEFTSSLEQASPKRSISHADKKQLLSHPKKSEPVKNVNILDSDDPFSSDPFNSPQQLVTRKQTVARRAMSCDPFISSSPPRATAAQDPSDGRNSYTTPGLSKRPDVKAHEADELDPFADSPPPKKQAAAGSVLGDLICIDDSSSSSENGHPSSDDELPSILEMDLTKRRARSPMRRTQSDSTWANRTASRNTHVPKPTRPKKTAAEREAENENRRQEREQLKAAKAVEKHRVAALAEVNKLRTDKKVSSPEMIVDLPSGLDTALQVQIKEMLQGLGVEHATWSCPDHNMIKWRRKVTSKFNEDMGLWEPTPPRIAHEEIALLVFVAEEFVSLALQDGALHKRIADIQQQHGSKKLVLVLQGMTAWTRKNRSNRNRKFTSGVLAAGDELLTAASSSSSTRSKARATAEYISEDIIEDAMLSLHVEHGILIHHTAAPIETAKWVVNFTQHISTIPYKKQKDQATSVAGFCMESGQVRTGDGVHDTYVRMLQEIVRITAPIAYGVAAEFNSVTKLVRGLEGGGPDILAAVRKSTNKDGAVSDRTVGQAVSRRVHRVFTGTDEDSTDV
ncbi:hypothetical protein E4U21_002357 [Claviceps maximensis]|nr:hypothetical protein E4U21_002357 [Claviceps maximensis]